VRDFQKQFQPRVRRFFPIYPYHVPTTLAEQPQRQSLKIFIHIPTQIKGMKGFWFAKSV
jgi:hypothetical protein